jgi:WD40 repeat protein
MEREFKKDEEMTEENPNDISVEEFEEEENDYIDDGLIDNEELENLQKHFEIQIVRENGGQNSDQDDVEMIQEDYKKEYENFKADGEIYSIAMNDKGLIVLGDGEDTTYFFDLNKKELIKKEKINKDSVTNVSFSNDYKYLATASLDGTVNVYETQDYTIINTLNEGFSDINVYN